MALTASPPAHLPSPLLFTSTPPTSTQPITLGPLIGGMGCLAPGRFEPLTVGLRGHYVNPLLNASDPFTTLKRLTAEITAEIKGLSISSPHHDTQVPDPWVAFNQAIQDIRTLLKTEAPIALQKPFDDPLPPHSDRDTEHSMTNTHTRTRTPSPDLSDGSPEPPTPSPDPEKTSFDRPSPAPFDGSTDPHTKTRVSDTPLQKQSEDQPSPGPSNGAGNTSDLSTEHPTGTRVSDTPLQKQSEDQPSPDPSGGIRFSDGSPNPPTPSPDTFDGAGTIFDISIDPTGARLPWTKSRSTKRPQTRRKQGNEIDNAIEMKLSVEVAPDNQQTAPARRHTLPPHTGEACACCNYGVDADEAVGLLKVSEGTPGGGHAEVLGIGGLFAILTLTGAYRVLKQTRTLVPKLKESIQPQFDQETWEPIEIPSHRLTQLKRSLHNVYVNAGATIMNVATTGGMLASLAVSTPVGWGLLAGYAGIQTIRHVQLAWRTRCDLNHHPDAHPSAIRHYKTRRTAYLGISASFAMQGIGATLIIGGMLSGVGAPLALVGLALVLAGSGSSLWLNNRYPRAYAPRNGSYLNIDRDSLDAMQRSALIDALETAKKALKEVHQQMPSHTKRRLIKKALRVVGAFPMLTKWQDKLKDYHDKLDTQRADGLSTLTESQKEQWTAAEQSCQGVLKQIRKPTATVTRAGSGATQWRIGGCQNKNCQDKACKATEEPTLDLASIRYMLRALCDDEMTMN